MLTTHSFPSLALLCLEVYWLIQDYSISLGIAHIQWLIDKWIQRLGPLPKFKTTLKGHPSFRVPRGICGDLCFDCSFSFAQSCFLHTLCHRWCSLRFSLINFLAAYLWESLTFEKRWNLKFTLSREFWRKRNWVRGAFSAI